MANNNNVRVDVNVTSNGTTAAETKEAAKLHNELNNVAKAATRVAKATSAARQGVRNANKGEGPEFREAGTARGIGGQTGAGGRDFAKQAQGLGGLVHVYATFAANLFAVSAAFGALQRAADVTNMVKGLDQLGAASGRNLGTLSKQLAAVTDGAISLQDAMTATAQATAGGMSSENLLRLGKVARSASQALGIDMPNAVSRLSRGITKIEPELLDEIGIMVRVDKAAQEYARTIGKTATSLTDFERRQAFANAVLTQGEEKFGAIEMAANPYQKILASIQNLTQAGLELVNKALGPLLNVLSQSPVALGATLLGITGILLKQALPAITQFKEGLADSAKRSGELAANVAKRRVSAFEFRNDDVMAANAAIIGDTKKTVEKLKNEYNDLAKTQTVGKNVRATLNNGDIFSEDGSKQAVKRISDIDKALEAHTNKSKELSDKRIAELTREKSMLSSIPAVIQANLKAQKLIETEDAKTDAARATGAFSSVALNERALKNLQRKALNSSVVSNAAENAATYGLGASLKMVREEIKAAEAGFDAMGKKLEGGPQKFNMLSRSLLTVRAGLAAVTSYAMLAASALNNVFMIVGVAVATFQVLDSLFSKSEKEASNFAESTDSVSASVDNMSRTMDLINKKKAGSMFSVEGIQAIANAMNDLSSSINKQIDDFGKLINAMGGWEEFWDSTKDLVGFGSVDKIAKSSSIAVKGMMESIKDSGDLDRFKNSLSAITGIEIKNPKQIEEYLEPFSRGQAYAQAGKIAELIKDFSNTANNKASDLTGFSNTLKEIDKQFVDINNTLRLNDPFTKFGTTIIGAGNQLEVALKQPINSLQSIIGLLDNSKNLSLFPKEKQLELVQYNNNLKELNTKLDEARKNLKFAEDERSKASKDVVWERGSLVENKTTANNTQNQLNKAKADLISVENSIKAETAKAKTILGDSTLFEKGLAFLSQGLKYAFESAAVSSAQAINGVMKSIGIDTSVEDIQLKKQEISLRIKEIEERGKFLREQIKSNILMKEANLQKDREFAMQKVKEGGDENINYYSGIITNINKDLEYIRQGNEFLSSKNVLKNLNSVKDPEARKGVTEAIGGIDSINSLSGISAQLAPLFGQLKAADLESIIAKVNRLNKDKANQLELDKKQNQVLLDSVSLTKDLGILQDTEIGKKVREVEVAKADLDVRTKQLDIQKSIDATTALINSGKATNLDQAKLALKNLEETLAILNRASAISSIKQAIDNEKKSQQERIANEQILLDYADRRYNSEKQRSEALNDLQSKELDILKNKNIYSETFLQKQQASLDLSKQSLSSADALRNLLKNQEKELNPSDINISAAKAGLNKLGISDPKAVEDRTNLSEEAKTLLQYLDKEEENRKRLTDLQAVELENLLKVNEAKLTGVKLVIKQAEDQAKYNEKLSETKDFADSLATAFGSVGTALGTLVTTITEFAEQTRKYNEERSRLEGISGDEKQSWQAREQASVAIYQLDKERAKSEEKNDLKVLANSKKIFKEKTFAYKAIDAIEKANHIASLARMAENAAKTIMSIPGDIAGGVAKLFKEGGWAGFAGAAAFLGLMASLGFGGGKSVPKPGFTAEDKQKTEGTGGQGYDAKGNIVATGGGVLGELTTKSESVANSITMMEKTGFKNLEFSNKMLEALIAIRENTKGLAKSIITSIPDILRQDPSSKGGNWLTGKTSEDTLDKGINIAGTIEQLLSGTGNLSQYRNVKRSSSGFLGLSFLGGGTSFSTERDNLEDKDGAISKAVAATISASTQVLTEASKKVGITVSKEFLEGFDLGLGDISSMGRTGEEFAKAIEGQIGIGMDRAVESIFPAIKEFTTIGESASQAFARIGRNVELFNQALILTESSYTTITESIDEVTKISTVNNIAAKNALVELAGGQEKFVESTQYFFSNFKTEAQKFDVNSKAVTDRMIELGYSSVDTKDEFNSLIMSLDLSQASAQKLWVDLMAIAPAFNDIAEATTKFNSELEDMNIRLLQMTGATDTAQQLSRDKVRKQLIDKMGGSELLAMQEQIWIQEDLAKTRKLDIELLQSQGKSYDALILQREEELRVLTESERVIKRQVYEAQDAQKFRKLDIELTKAQGRGYDAMLATREDEIKGLSENEKVLRKLIWAEEDRDKTLNLELGLMEALGMTYEALLIKRERDLGNMSVEDGLIQRKINTAIDYAKTQSLEIDLLDAMGYTQEAVTARRRLELRGMKASDAELKTRIWLLEDEKKLLDAKTSQEIRIYELLGQSSDALRLTRAKELKELDPQLVASQLYIYALEDEADIKSKLKDAYDKESTTIKTTISATRDFIKTLKDYKNALLLSDKSILTPAQKYAEAKRQFLQITAIATSTAITDAQKDAQAEAIGKIPSAGDAFLEASRTLYASSEAYTTDFSYVLSILDSTTSGLEKQQSSAEKQLTVLESSKTIQEIIRDNTKSSSDLLNELVIAAKNTATARDAAALGGSAAAGGVFTAPTGTAVTDGARSAIVDSGSRMILGTGGWSGSFEAAQKLITDSVAQVDAGTMSAADLIAAIRRQGISGAQLDTILGVSPGASSAWALAHGIPGFARGGVANGVSLVGEMGPELVNFNNPSRVHSNRETRDLFNTAELVNEIRALREEVAQLRSEQREQTGHLIQTNYDANAKAAEKVAAANADAANANTWANRSMPKLA